MSEKPANFDDDRCEQCGMGIGECRQWWRMGRQCCATCYHPSSVLRAWLHSMLDMPAVADESGRRRAIVRSGPTWCANTAREWRDSLG